MGNTKINLIRGEGRSLAGIARLEDILRRVSWIGLIIIFISSVIIGVSYGITTRSLASLDDQKVTLVQNVNQQVSKEGLLLSLVERTRIATKALSVAKPWGKLFTLLTLAAPEDVYQSIAIDETTLVTAMLEFISLEDAVAVVTNITSLAIDHRLRSPQLQSFSMQEDGNIQMTISFFPVL